MSTWVSEDPEKMEKIIVTCTAADRLPIDSILEFQGDLKKLSKENREKLKKSILKNGFTAPIFIWQHGGDNFILDGHQRLATLLHMRQKGYDIPLLPVAYIEAENEQQAKEKLLVITSQYGEFDLDVLNDWVSGIDDDIADILRFSDSELDFKEEDKTETLDDDELPEDVEPITKLGDLWELGRHRVLCGDSTDTEMVARLMNGQKADMVFCDPPYGMFLDADFSSMEGIGTGKKYDNIIGDHEDFTPKLITTVFDNLGYCKEIFMWGADYYTEMLPKRNAGSWIVWDKMRGGEGVNDNYDKMFGSNFELCWSKGRHKRAIARVLWKGIFGLNGKDEDIHKRIHPTQKPIELCIWFIEKFSKDNKIITDLYLGSGSTLIACEKTNRICYGMELDPHYCDVIVNRYKTWCETNGRTPIIKLNGEIIIYES